MGIDALDNKFPLPKFSELIYEFPIHRGVGCPHASHIDTFEHRALTDRAGRLTPTVVA